MYNKEKLTTGDFIAIWSVAICLFIVYFWLSILAFEKMLTWISNYVGKKIVIEEAIIGLFILVFISIFIGKLLLMFTTKYYIKLFK